MAYRNSQQSTYKLCKDVIDNVIRSLAATFFDSGIPDGIREELRTSWMANFKKLGTVTDFNPEQGQDDVPSIIGFPIEPILFLPPTSATMIPVLVQNPNTAMTHTLTVPAGIIREQVLERERFLQIMEKFMNDETKSGIGIGIEVADAILQEEINKALMEEGYSIQSKTKGKAKPRPKAWGRRGRGRRPAAVASVAASAIPQGDANDWEEWEDEDDANPLLMQFANDFRQMFGTNKDVLFSQDNTIICQYEKVLRKRFQWKFVLKDGIIKVNGKEYVFGKGKGESIILPSFDRFQKI